MRIDVNKKNKELDSEILPPSDETYTVEDHLPKPTEPPPPYEAPSDEVHPTQPSKPPIPEGSAPQSSTTKCDDDNHSEHADKIKADKVKSEEKSAESKSVSFAPAKEVKLTLAEPSKILENASELGMKVAEKNMHVYLELTNGSRLVTIEEVIALNKIIQNYKIELQKISKQLNLSTIESLLPGPDLKQLQLAADALQQAHIKYAKYLAPIPQIDLDFKVYKLDVVVRESTWVHRYAKYNIGKIFMDIYSQSRIKQTQEFLSRLAQTKTTADFVSLCSSGECEILAEELSKLLANQNNRLQQVFEDDEINRYFKNFPEFEAVLHSYVQKEKLFRKPSLEDLENQINMIRKRVVIYPKDLLIRLYDLHKEYSGKSIKTTAICEKWFATYLLLNIQNKRDLLELVRELKQNSKVVSGFFFNHRMKDFLTDLERSLKSELDVEQKHAPTSDSKHSDLKKTDSDSKQSSEPVTASAAPAIIAPPGGLRV